MSEVVEALRGGADDEAAKMFCPHLVEAAENAAATIERLTAERDRMREALRSVEEWWLADGMYHFVGAPYAIFAARAALSSQQQAMQEKP